MCPQCGARRDWMVICDRNEISTRCRCAHGRSCLLPIAWTAGCFAPPTPSPDYGSCSPVGMAELHFSRCTEPRWTWDVPYIAPMMDGGFFVAGPSRTQSVAPAPTVEAAIAMVVERLPPGCGRAFVGTPEELAEKEQSEQSERTPIDIKPQERRRFK